MKPTITVDRAFRRLIPPLAEDERAKLESSIVEAGKCRDPLVLWNGILIDGHNRFEIATRHRLPFTTTTIDLPDRLAVTIWIRWNQLGRRNLTDDQRAIIAEDLIEDLAKQSKHARATKAGKLGGRGNKRENSRDTASRKLSDKTSQRTKVSRRARVSERKVRQARAIKQRAPELIDQIISGEKTLAEATRAIRPAVRAEKLASVVWPEGKHGVILADPPWRPDDGVLDPTRRIENQYPTMTLDELIAWGDRVRSRAADDCVLLLWTTAQKLSDAARLVEAWGFVVKSGAVWIKPSIGMGYWFRQRHELLVLATRGAPMTPLEADRPDSVIEATRRGHSEKPDLVYALIERMFPGVPKLELFCRADRPGWARVTNEPELRIAQ